MSSHESRESRSSVEKDLAEPKDPQPETLVELDRRAWNVPRPRRWHARQVDDVEVTTDEPEEPTQTSPATA